MNAKRKWSTLLPAMLAEAWLPSGATGAYALVLYRGDVSPTDFVVFWAFCTATVLWAFVVGACTWRWSQKFPALETKKAWALVWRRSPCSFFERCLVHVFCLGVRWCSPNGSAKPHWKVLLKVSFVALSIVACVLGMLFFWLNNGYEILAGGTIMYVLLRLLTIIFWGYGMEEGFFQILFSVKDGKGSEKK